MMDRANYKKVLKTLGYDEIYNCPSGSCMDFGSCTRIDIDNTSGKATEAIERIISYVDALLYEVDIKEPAGATDRFTFILDDERYSLDIDYMAQDADDEDWECWQFLRSEILSAKQIHIEYRYVGDADVAEDLLETGLKHMLDDVLADGMLANCVRFCIQIATGGSDEGEGLEAHCRRYLWINGIHNGQYICGEIPFEKNDELIRSCGGWRQSDSACNDCDGIFLNLHPRTSPLLLNRLRKCIKDFTRKIHCNAEIMLSPEEYRRRYMDDVSSYITPSMTDKAMDDKEQKEFPDLRKYFSADEVDCLLNRYPTLSRLYVKHADESYTTDDLERIRFLWTLVLMGELEGENRTVKRSNGVWDKINPTNDYMKVFYQLPEDIRLRLYGTSEYERTTSFGRERLIPTTNNFGTKFINTHTGLGDLSIMEEAVKGYIWGCGYGVHINMISTKRNATSSSISSVISISLSLAAILPYIVQKVHIWSACALAFCYAVVMLTGGGLIMTTRECVANRIIELCRERNMTINGLARLSALPPSTLKNIVNGVSQNPGIVTIKKLCDGLEITLVEFFDTEEFRALEQEIQ